MVNNVVTDDNTMTDLVVDDLIKIYRLMLLGRRYGENALEWYRKGRIYQLPYVSIGQEAVGVGACYGLRPSDWVLPSLRTNEVYWTRGVTVLDQLNTVMGNAKSITGGKETSNHAAYPNRGILAGTGIIGSQFPVATGAALGLQMRGGDNVVLCFFGDGASNRGDFHEGLNLAAVLKAPVIFVCENNAYGFTTPASAVVSVKDIADRAISYEMPGHVVDGQDVIAVHRATQEAVLRARRGDGPTLLECKTYRYLPHTPLVEEDRPADELNSWLKRDPITILGDKLKRDGHWNETAKKAMEKAIQKELDDAIQQAEAVGLPDPKEVFNHIYNEPAEVMGL